MADSIGSRILARIYKSVSGVDPDGRGHGPYSEANDGWVDSKPYVSHWRQGLFEGYDGSLWLYMAFPKDVQIRWLPNDWEKIENQSFFVDMCKDLASMFSSQEDKLKNDLRRDIHIQVTQEPSKGIVPPVNDTPAHADYLRRIAANYTKPVWRSFIGVKLIEGSLFDRAYSIKDTIRRYIDSFTEIELLRANAFISDLNHVHDIMLKHGFTDIDFVEDGEALERLTAWHGVSDEQFSMRRQLQDQKLHVPVHGRSIITPRWGELYMSALRPSESLDYVDPMSNAKSTRWATPLLSPSSDVVAISIRAQIRADDVIDNMLDMKNSNKNKDSGTGKGSLSYGDLIFAARESVTRNHIPMLDNTEIIIASKVPKARTAETALEKMFAKSGMDIALLHGRQDTALLSTLPTYPRHVMSIPRGNAKRPHLSNALMPGVIAFSTLFQSSRPLASGGIMVGLGDDKSSYPEIMIELDAASRLNGTPVWLVSGRPGAGKALSLDTPIQTPDGPITMGEVKVGDTVFGSDGATCSVTSVTPVMNDHEVYRVTLSDGQSFLADADHQWYVSSHSDRHYKTTDGVLVENLKRRSMIETLTKASETAVVESITLRPAVKILDSLLGEDNPWKSPGSLWSALEFVDYDGFEFGPMIDVGTYSRRKYVKIEIRSALRALAERLRQNTTTLVNGEIAHIETTKELLSNMEANPGRVWSIPVSAVVQYPERDLPVDPYVLGAWLGDGETGTGRIAAASVGGGFDPRTGETDQESMLRNTSMYNPTIKNDYVISCHGLSAGLREIGVINSKHIPEMYMRSSFDQRLALLQGLMDSDGNAVKSWTGGVCFNNTDRALISQVVELVRSLGIKVDWETCPECGYDCDCDLPAPYRENIPVVGDREVVQRKFCFGVTWTTELPMFRLRRKLMNVTHDDDAITARHGRLYVESIEQVESVPVRCITVDSPDSSYLIGQGVVTHNTQAMLQLAVQAVMQGDFVAYYNPKQTGTLKPFFDYMGGVTISMKRSYLQDNPGLADPFFFLEEREAIANVISDAVITSMKMTSDHGSSSAARRTSVSARIKDRCLDPRYRSTREVLLGNGSTLPPLEDEEVVKFVKDKEKVSPFWSSFMAPPNAASVISTRLKNAKAILFEWDDSMALPPADKRPEDYTDNETDTMLSLVTMFQYSVARARAIGKQSMIICDEAHVLKGSSEAMNTINRAGREWRQANINLILGTQEMKDFLGSPAENGESEMASFIGRYIIMAIAPESRSDLEWFFRISKLPKDSEDPKNIAANTYARYIIGAGADSAKSSGGSKIVRAYMVDHIYGWSGGIIVGPWPKRELDLGRTDKGAEEERRRMGLNKTFQQILDDKETQEEDLSVMRSNGSYGGFLAGVITQESDEDSDEDGNSDVN